MSMNQNWTNNTEEKKVEVEKNSTPSMSFRTSSPVAKETGSQGAKETTSSQEKDNQEEDKKKKKGVFIAIAAVAALLLLGIGGFGVYSMVKKGNAAAAERDNTMSLIQRYFDRGEYDRALDLLEDLLI